MQMQWKSIFRHLFTAGAVLMLPFAASSAFATCMGTCPSATGTLTVTATVNSSITFNFGTDPTTSIYSVGSPATTATLDFGQISAYGYSPASTTGITFTAPSSQGGSWTVSAPVVIDIKLGNATGCTITAQGTDNNYAYTANGISISTTQASTDISGGNCKTSATNTFTVPIALTIPGGPSTHQPSNTITFTATAD